MADVDSGETPEGSALPPAHEPTIRVLVVEAGDSASRMLRSAPSAGGFEVALAADVESAFSQLRGQVFDVAVLDLSLPEGNGVELLMKANEVLQALPVVVLADQPDEALALEALRFGAQDYLCKERIDAEDLARSVRHSLERHHLKVQLSEARRREHHLATHDALTGLPNRHWLDEYLKRMIAAATRRGTGLAVLFLDLDGFKRVNDTLGHRAGDHLLKEVATRLSAVSRQNDAITRLGGDEFILMISDFADTHTPAQFAQKILQAVEQPYRVEGTDQWLTGSIGIALASSDGDTPEELIRCADIAMYQAKAEGRNRYFFYREGLNREVAERASLVTGLREALNQDHLLLHYQPQIDLLSGELIGAEALIRWQHPERGLVSPGEFVPIAEESGLMGPIGLWVMRRALEERHRWQAAGHRGLRISVNVSAQQLSKEGFSGEVAQLLQEVGVGDGALEIEITESAVLSRAETIAQNLAALRTLGVGVALDDFGTGYSSLTLLQRLPVDTLKIDRSFVSKILTDQTTRVIVASLIELSKQLGITPVAEGVETDEDVDQLHALGCRQLQGYLLAKPMEGDELLAYMNGRSAPWDEPLERFYGRVGVIPG